MIKFFKRKSILSYKRSRKHPMIGKRYFHESFGFCTVDRVWNIRTHVPNCQFNYEADKHVKWTEKVRIQTDEGIYILPLYEFVLHAVEKDGKKINDDLIYCHFA